MKSTTACFLAFETAQARKQAVVDFISVLMQSDNKIV